MRFLPGMYKKSVLDIDYDKLKEMGIKCLLFDLDNTISINNVLNINEDIINLFNRLKKNYIIYIVSNTVSKKRIRYYAEKLGVKYYSFSMKPLNHNFYRIKKERNLEKKEMCMIGDQLLTDIYGANKFGCFSILIDPLDSKDLKITRVSRRIERFIFNRYNKKGIMSKGDYYD